MELKKQAECFESIKNLCANYKKDSISRKTIDNLEKRLKSLEELWEEFHDRHELLLEEIVDKTNVNYFVTDVYEKTMAMYESTKNNIMTLLVYQRQDQRQKLETNSTSILEVVSDETTLKMKKQECNFKALDRAMSKVDIEILKEKWEMEDHLATMKTKWESIDKLHWELESTLNESALKKEYCTRFENIELKYDTLRKLINTKLWSSIHYQNSAPKIDIPVFSGDYINWISFKDLFIQTIHDNPNITKSQKMQHLKTKLKGEAERLVQHLTISSENYDSCWEILNHRYDNRRLQFTSFMNTMQQLPTIQLPTAYNLKRMHDVITESINGLGNMGIEVTNWGPMIVYYMLQKLDATTFTEYTKEMQNNRELPDLQELLTFLESKFMAYETVKIHQKDQTTPKKPFYKDTFKPIHRNFSSNNYNNYQKKTDERPSYLNKQTIGDNIKEFNKSFHAYKTYGNCPLCSKDHVLMQCPEFVDMSSLKRNDTVLKLNVCKNCLFDHGTSNCMSSKTCKECNLKHHTLLHNNNYKPTGMPERMKNNQIISRPSTSQQPNSHHLSTNDVEVLLTTIKVMVKTNDGTYVLLRALLDQGSQVNLITENAAQLLRLPRNKLNASISGVGAVAGDCHGRLRLSCKSIHSDFSFNTEALILTKLTNNLPNCTFDKANWPHINNLKLADPEYNVSGSIDLLLGADVYADIILEGVLKGDQHAPIAQQTQLGWILCGKLKTFNCHVTLVNIAELTKYWESEDITQGVEDITRDDKCEKHYQETTRRSPDGKYIVEMPMIQNYEESLGKSRPAAISQFLQLEKRLQLPRNQKLSQLYREFIHEYYELGHMTPSAPITTAMFTVGQEYYLPHHGVFRESSTTTKLRVVFNASQKTSSGKSLNSLMEKGPNLQKDIQALILKWRTYEYVFIADIEKMYRGVWLSENQKQLQKIIWRDSPTEKLQEFTLNTLTYGMKSAPWLAMRTLKQLALDEGHKYPEAAKVLENSFYLDDLIGGHQSLQTAKTLINSLIKLIKEGGMNLRKWSSNKEVLLEGLSQDQISTKPIFDFKQEDTLKTLGLGWSPNLDSFMFNWNLEKDSKKKLTKRTLLSQISQLYDPLGWLSPVTITAKLIFQKVWTENIQWDEELPESIQNDWLKLKTEIPNLKSIKLNRWIGTTSNRLHLFGFCDASEKAYSCVIYTHAKNEKGQPVLSLLVAKTRVAPLSHKLSLPRLELCGAMLLSQLMEKVKNVLKGFNITMWAWLQGEASRWEKYVENRVQKIKQCIPAQHWSYIESKTNSADCATRGLYPNKMVNFKLWWEGPALLKTFEVTKIEDPLKCLFTTNIEVKQTVPTLKTCNSDENIITNYLNKCSSLTRVTRVMAWVLRFIKNTSNPVSRITKPEACKNNYLTTVDLLAANKMVIQKATESQKTIRTSKKTFTTLLIALFTLVIGVHSAGRGTSSSAARITSLEPDRPIYYDALGKMQTIHDEWILLMYYNLTNYWDDIQRVENYLHNLTNLCHKTDPRYCKTTLEQLSHEMELLQHYNSLLLTPHKHLGNRKKRGLINGIGSIANSLFGVLDQDFADKYHQDIKNIQNNQNYLLGLMKNQTSIVELENKALKKTEENIHNQLNMVDSFMNETESNLAKVESTMEIIMASSYFNSASLATYLLLKNLREMQELLFDTLTNVYKGHMDVHLLTPVNLVEQLNIIAGSLPKRLSLPLENVTLRTVCDNDVSSYIMTSSSIVTLKQGCLLQSSDFTIYSRNEYNTNMKMESNFNIGLLNSTVNNIVNLTYHKVPWDILGMEEMQDIDRRLGYQKEREILPETMTTHDVHQYAICYTLLAIVFIVIITIIWVVKKYLPHILAKSKQQRSRGLSNDGDIELQTRSNQKRVVQKATDHAASPPRTRGVQPSVPTKGEDNVAFTFDE